MKDYEDALKCEHCSKHINDFVAPEIPEHPQLIIVGEAPGKAENEKHKPFVGEAGQILRPMMPVPAIYINARNTYSTSKPTTEEINIERETHLLPLLKDFPDLPVISLGAYATQALMPRHRAGKQKEPKKNEKKKSKETSMAGEVLWLYDRPVWFTYHPAYYFYAGRDPRIKAFIRGYINAALSPAIPFQTRLNELPPFGGERFVLDVETDGDDYPWYGTQLLLLGIRSEKNEISYQFTPDWLEVPGNLFSLQAWLDSQKQVIGHGLLFDILHSGAYGLDFSKLEWYDTIISEKNQGLDPLWGYGLKATAHMKFKAFGWEAKFHTALADMKKNKKVMLWLPVDFRDYNAADLYYTMRLYMDAPASRFTRLDNDYLKNAVSKMVNNGIYLDRHALAKMMCKYKGELRIAQHKAREQAGLGPDFNFNSPKQMLPVLRRLVAEDIENTKEQTLMTVLDKSPFVQTVLDIRGAEKQLEMLIEIKHRMIERHVVHTHMTAHGAKTSRTTSKEPNVQNWAKPIRKILVSRYK